MAEILFRDIESIDIYIFGVIEKALSGKQQSGKGEKIATGIKMPLKLIFLLYFIAPIYDLLIAECMAHLNIYNRSAL